jgi:hypothetical protein
VDLSSNWLLASLLVGTVGMGIFIYGKKQRRSPQLIAGIALMAISYVVSSPVWMSACAVLIVGALWYGTKNGF